MKNIHAVYRLMAPDQVMKWVSYPMNIDLYSIKISATVSSIDIAVLQWIFITHLSFKSYACIYVD